MHPEEVEKEPVAREARLQYINICLETFDRSRQTFSPWYRKLLRWYDLYRGYRRRPTDPQWNDIHVPLLFSIVHSDVAWKVRVLLGGDPYVAFVPGGPEDQSKARRAEKLVGTQLVDAGLMQKGVRLLELGDMYGTAVWRRKWRKQYGSTWRRIGDLGGERIASVPSTKTGLAGLRFNGPDWDPLDPADFFPFPGFVDIADMVGVVHRFYQEFEDVVVNSEPGPDGSPPVYAASEVRMMSGTSPSSVVNDERAWRRNAASGGVDDKTWQELAAFSKPVEILEYWGRVPRDLGAVDPKTGEFVTEFVITVADRRWLLRATPNPFWDREKPFGVYRPFEDPHFFHAPGKIEINEKLQAAANRVANTKLDVLDLFISPPTFFDENGGLDPRRTRLRPGALIPVRGEPQKAVWPFVPDLRGVQTAYQETEQIWRWIQQSSGIIEDTVMGQGSTGSDRQTAREYLGRSESVSTRLALEARLAETGWLEPLAQGFFEMDRQFLDLSTEIKLIGGSAVWDSATGTFVPPEPFTLDLEMLSTDYDIRATGATRQLSKQARGQNAMALLQVLGALPPQLIVQVNWFAFLRQLMPLFDFPNVDELLNTQDQVIQAIAIAQQMQAEGAGAGAGGAPGGGAEGAQGPGIDPEALLSQVLGLGAGNGGLGGAGGSSPGTGGNAGA